MKNKMWIAGFLLGLTAITTQAVVTVTNLAVAQVPGTKTVEIAYDVHSTDNNAITISLVVSNGVALVSAPSVLGDIGNEVAIGTNKLITWNAGADWNGNVSALHYMIIADDGMNLMVPSGMVLIPGGTNEGVDPDEGAYSLTVSSFCMDETEVTKAFWDSIYDWALENGYAFNHTGSGKGTDHPVQTVFYFDCIKWCNARSEKEGRTPYYKNAERGWVYRGALDDEWGCYPNANGYRLPTPEEWEYAACGGLISQRFPWGNTISRSNANYYSSPSDPPDYDLSAYDGFGYHPDYATGELPYTSPVRSFAANGYGLYDMVGNVSEWCGTPEFNDPQENRGGSYFETVDSVTRVHESNPPMSEVWSQQNSRGFRTICR